MKTHTTIKHRTLLTFGILIAFGAVGAQAEETLRLYGPLGTSPAIEEAAIAFAARANIDLEVVTGPVSQWNEKAGADGDLVFCAGDFVLSDLVRSEDAVVDARSVAPLYVRPSAILVRPENAKDIRDFPDLLRPGMKVMIVNGSGKSGLWENMTGRLQSIENLVALQKNIAVCAKDANEATHLWKERKDIDAWLVWNIWHMPRRDSAKVIPISQDYLIYREATVALTPKGTQNETAKAFVDYLASAEGAELFDSWGWLQPPPDAAPAIADRGVSVACQIKKNVWTHQVGRGLERVHRLVVEYRSLGVPAQDIHICALFDDETAYWALADEAYRKYVSTSDENPNRHIVDELISEGVSVEVSAQTLRENEWQEADIIPGVKIIGGADERITELGSMGYAYLSY